MGSSADSWSEKSADSGSGGARQEHENVRAKSPALWFAGRTQPAPENYSDDGRPAFFRRIRAVSGHRDAGGVLQVLEHDIHLAAGEILQDRYVLPVRATAAVHIDLHEDVRAARDCLYMPVLPAAGPIDRIEKCRLQ